MSRVDLTFAVSPREIARLLRVAACARQMIAASVKFASLMVK
jgi:hypothetical protein